MSASRLRVGLFTAFGGLGVTAAFVPAVLPSAEHATDADLSAAVPVLFAGLLVGVLLSGPLLVRRPPRTTLVLGSLLQAAAIVGRAIHLAAAGVELVEEICDGRFRHRLV